MEYRIVANILGTDERTVKRLKIQEHLLAIIDQRFGQETNIILVVLYTQQIPPVYDIEMFRTALFQIDGLNGSTISQTRDLRR